MSGKQLDAKNIVNELKGSSVFFQQGNDSSISDSPPNDAPTAPVVSPATSHDAQVASYPSQPLSASQDSFQSHSRPVEANSKEIDSGYPPVQIPVPPATSSSPEPTERPLLPPRTIVGSNEPPNERANGRTKVRHSFDIHSDQLFALRELAVERERVLGHKVLLGDLVQEALDLFISREQRE